MTFHPSGPLAVEAVTWSGRAASVECDLNRNTVEVQHRGTMTASFSGRDLHSWPFAPSTRRCGTAPEFTSTHERIEITVVAVEASQPSPIDRAVMRVLGRRS